MDPVDIDSFGPPAVEEGVEESAWKRGLKFSLGDGSGINVASNNGAVGGFRPASNLLRFAEEFPFVYRRKGARWPPSIPKMTNKFPSTD